MKTAKLFDYRDIVRIVGCAASRQRRVGFELDKNKYAPVYPISRNNARDREVYMAKKASQAFELPGEGFVRIRDVLKVFPISKSQWHRGVREGRYPKPISLGLRTSAYRVEDIRALIQKIREAHKK